jgi:excisionase family DNA binding protein
MPENTANTVEGKLDEIIALLAKLVSTERPKPQRLLRVGEAARYLRLSPGSVRALIQRGELPVVRPSNGNHAPWLIDVKDCDAWIERSKT